MELKWKQYSVYGESTLNVFWKYEYFMNVLEYKYWVLPFMSTQVLSTSNCVFEYSEYEYMSTSTLTLSECGFSKFGSDSQMFIIHKMKKSMTLFDMDKVLWLCGD